MTTWSEFADFLTALDREDRERFGRYAFLQLPETPDAAREVLQEYSRMNPETTPAELVATAVSQASAAGDREFARDLGPVALDAAGSDRERQLAHVAIAQAHFRNRKNPEEMAGFERHCRAAIEAGHAGTFCYERLAALHEYRGELEEVVSLCARATRVLREAGDERSAVRFEQRGERVRRKLP